MQENISGGGGFNEDPPKYKSREMQKYGTTLGGERRLKRRLVPCKTRRKDDSKEKSSHD